ncbi:MAG: hypothetical protein D6758_03590, partial [Gammaproteobacteria bacterium]
MNPTNKLETFVGPGRMHGLSLIELMVALVLSLFLIGGVIQVFLSGKQTYQTVTGQSQVSETARAAEYLLAAQLHQAGYWDDVDAVRRFVAVTDFAADAVVAGQNNVTGSSTVLAGTDELRIRFTGAADGSIQTCMGGQPGSDLIITERFYVRPASTSNPEPSLMCEVTQNALDRDTGAVGAQISKSAVPLIDGVEAFQVLYGAGLGSVQFMDAGSISNWSRVRSVRFAVLLSSGERASAQARASGFEVLGQTVADQADGHVRQVLQHEV